MKKIYGFYNVGMINNWFDIYTKQLSNVVDSGLLAKCEQFYIQFLGKEDDFNTAKAILTPFKNITVLHNIDILVFDFPLMEIMRNKAITEDEFYTFYIHSKGVTQQNNEGYYGYASNFEHLYACVNDWRVYMEYFIIRRHDMCISTLDMGYDCCGCNWDELPEPHFSGNFWWAKSSHIKNLPSNDNLDLKNRYQTKSWIGMVKSKQYCLFKNKAGYINRISPITYMDNNDIQKQNDSYRWAMSNYDSFDNMNKEVETIYTEQPQQSQQHVLTLEDDFMFVIDSGRRLAGFFSYFMQIVYNVSKINQLNKGYIINLTHDMVYQDSKIPNPNVWEYYFTQPYNTSAITEETKFVDVGLFIDNGYKQRFTKQDNIVMHETFNKNFTISDIILNKVNDFYNEKMLNHKVLGIHVRKTDHFIDGFLLSNDYYLSKINEELANDNYDRILLCTDDANVITDFKSIYGEMLINYDTNLRSNNSKSIHHGVGLSNPYKAGEDVIIESLLLSKTDFLLRGVSNVTSATMVFNPYLKNRTIDLHIKYEG